MKKILLSLFALGPIIGLTQAQTYTQHATSYDGHDIGFYLFLPPGYESSVSYRYPVIIYFHGQQWVRKDPNSVFTDLAAVNNDGLPMHLNAGKSMQFATSYGSHTDAFIVLIPQKMTDLDENGQEKQFPQYYVEGMLKYARDSIRANMRRVFLTGPSNGGGISWDYPTFADSTAIKIAGIVPVSGQPVFGYDSAGTNEANLCRIAKFGIAAKPYHGTGDPVVPPANAQKAVNHVNNVCFDYPLKIDAQLKIIPTIQPHHPNFWNLIYDPDYNRNDTSLNMYQWMLEITGALALPVRMDYFKGKNLSEANILEWATSEELNFQRFEVHRSQNGRDFSMLGVISPTTGSRGQKIYSYKDLRAPKGLSHYKLKMFDKDGSYEFSKVISVDNQNKVYSVERYPNPVLDDLNVVIEGNMFGNIEISILDLKGNMIRKENIRKDQVKWQGRVDVKALAKGIYVMQVKAADGKKDISTFIRK